MALPRYFSAVFPFNAAPSVWHDHSVQSLYSLLRRLPCAVLLLLPTSALPQARARPPQRTVRPAHRPATPAVEQRLVGNIDQLIHRQQTAVAAGDPAAIVVASTDLNAQILTLLAQFQLAHAHREEAITLYRQSLDLVPSTTRRLEFASALLRAGDAAAALTETDAIVATDPTNAVAWIIRGSALKDLNRERDAIAAFSRALELRPDPSVAFKLGSTYLAIHDKHNADALFARLLSASGNNAVWYIAVGDAYRDAGFTEDAIANFEKGLKLDPRALHGEFFLGLTYLQMHQWGPSSESFRHLRNAVEQSPHEYISNFYLGALESTDGSDLPSSDRHLHAAAEADPSQPEVWLYLGINANRERRTAEAKTYLQKAIDLTGSDESRNNYQVRRAYFSLGRILIAEGKRSEGEALMARYKTAEQAAVAESGQSIAQSGTMAAEENPLRTLVASTGPRAEIPSDHPSAEQTKNREIQSAVEDKLRGLLANSWNDLGTAKAREHDYPAALQAFQESRRWDASNLVTLRNLGVAAFRVQNSVEAASALESYQKTQHSEGKPLDPSAQMMLALSQFSLGRFADAAASFDAVQDLALQDQRSAYSFAFSLARIGKDQEANRVLDTLMNQPLGDELLPLVCHVYMDTENYNQSQVCYRRALQQIPLLHLAHYEIGESLIRLDRPADAIPDLRQELQLSPDNPNVLAALAFALLQTGQKDEARTLLERAVAASPQHAESQYELGKLLLDGGDAAAAVPHLESSEAADASKDYVHYQLGVAYRKLGRTEDAQRELRAYREIKDTARGAHATAH